MAQVCRQCARVNPSDALYCYFDGVTLGGHSGSGPVNAGSAPFPSHFVFPTGQICKNFDQLALACQHDWPTAADMLKQGFLGTFFGGMGRADLALAALEAAKFPDIDRGLDQLLAKLPTQVLQEPKLKAEPSEINLGQIPMQIDRASEIHLSNQGMRLVYGSVAADCKWLALGEGPGANQKLFQFGAESVIPVHIKGQHLRAGSKPLEGRLVVESNGGTATVIFRADVPITPFPGGLFDGCTSPRQVAEKAKANPKSAALYFENGAVAQWFTSNGWIYPVQGPSARGLGGVQQFFEALGLAKPPKVTISSQSLSFHGDGGQSLHATIEVNAVVAANEKKKPVYAYATCDQPWVDCSKVKLAGASAKITVAIPRVPNRPGETLQASVKVIGNGKQKFTVPLLLSVDKADPNPPAELTMDAAPSSDLILPAAEGAIVAQAETPFADFAVAAPAPMSAATATGAGEEPILLHSSGPHAFLPTPREGHAGRRRSVWLHLTPLALLVIALASVLMVDAFTAGPDSSGSDIDDNPRVRLYFDYADKQEKGIGNTMTFGLVTVDPANRKADDKKLTYELRGSTNSTVLKIDGLDYQFGNPGSGRWDDKPKPHGKYGGRTATFLITEEQVLATQRVEIIPGEAIEIAPEVYKRLLDTCLVRYTLKNRDSKPHQVALRVLLDTYVGANDGCPFTIPGSAKLVSTFEDFNPSDPKNKKPIPDFVQALEFEDLKQPGTIAQVNFRLGDKIETPSRVSLTQWPGRDYLRKYDIPVRNIEKDSAVVMYWQSAELEPGKTRELGFSYGVGNLAAQSEKIALTIGGSHVVKGELSVVALIADAERGQQATLELPPGAFSLLDSPATQAVPPSTEKAADGRLRASPVTWRLRADRDGSYALTVKTSNNLEATRKIAIKKSSIF